MMKELNKKMFDRDGDTDIISVPNLEVHLEIILHTALWKHK